LKVLRCGWATNELAVKYHDEEWGVPVHDDHRWFEFLILEGAQAGLSWDTILAKRENYRIAYDRFDPTKVARYSDAEIQKLLANPGIVRNRLKLASSVKNAKSFLDIQREFGTFDAYIWRFTGGSPIINRRKGNDVPAKTPESDAMSKDLRKRGFNFVGSTICYALMQATGMVNAHAAECFRWEALSK
jgi:DNA-3-methyladenine glycosylase I